MGLRRAFTELWREWASRRAGRRHVRSDIRLHARDVAGITGWLYSRGWDQVASTSSSYRRSFEDPRIPPSLHVSERDRRRRGSVVPLVERCLEDQGRRGDRT